MQFMIYTEDRDDGLPIRKANRDAHLAWLKEDKGADVLAWAQKVWQILYLSQNCIPHGIMRGFGN